MRMFGMLLVALIGSSAIAKDTESLSSYLCIADMGTGFINDSGKWQSTAFNVADRKYILRRPNEDDIKAFNDVDNATPWVWEEFGGGGLGRAPCAAPNSREISISCRNHGMVILIDTDSLRYQLYWPYGYVRLKKNDVAGEAPRIEIGRCSPL